MACQNKTDDHADGVGREHDRDHERREAVTHLIERVQRAGHGGERHRGEECRRNHPEADAVSTSRGR